MEKRKKLIFSYLVSFFASICIIVIMVFGIKHVWQSTTDLSMFKISPSTYSFNTPTWATDRFSNNVKHVSALNKTYSMYENNLTAKIADIYGGSVLIKKVDSIKRIFPNKLNIRLVLRKPTALVKSGRNTYLVDDDTVLLPKEYYLLPNSEYDNPYIQINKPAKLPSYGGEWNDKGIKAGVELVKFLRANNAHKMFKILAVDVANVCKKKTTGKSDIVLWTENNTQIRWGCSTLCNEPNELSNENKLQNLLSIAKKEGPNLKNMDYVDVRWQKPVGKQLAKTDDFK